MITKVLERGIFQCLLHPLTIGKDRLGICQQTVWSHVPEEFLYLVQYILRLIQGSIMLPHLLKQEEIQIEGTNEHYIVSAWIAYGGHRHD